MSSKSERQRVFLGVHMSTQVVAFVLAALALATVVGLAVLTWLERTA